MKRKITYTKYKEYAEDISYENELNDFIKDIADNTPHEGQFDEEENLDKEKKNNNRSR